VEVQVTDGQNRGLGKWGEEFAARLLTRKGYRLVTRNWRCVHGEIDLVAEKDSCLAFVEVRTRRGESLGSPEESVTDRKRARLISSAEAYVQSTGWQAAWQIDVVAIQLDRRGRLVRVDHYENAVTG